MSRLPLWMACGVGVALFATPSAGQDAPSTTVQSVVVVDGQVLVSDVSSANQSGLTISPVRETDEERVRRDAKEILEASDLTPLHQPVQPVETVVDVENVVVETATSRSTACVQVGVVGAKSNCRPPQ